MGNDNASPITIRVSRDLLMHANSAILALNTVSGGRGGDIAITTGRNMTMNAGATISVTGTGSSGNSPAGSVNVTDGNYPNAPGVGIFTMEASSQIDLAREGIHEAPCIAAYLFRRVAGHHVAVSGA